MKQNKKVQKAIYSGTFDPISKGHLSIIKRSAKMFDEVIVAVAKSSAKKPLFTLKQRQEMLSISLKGLNNVKVIAFEGLMVDFCQTHHANIILRGVRNVGDFDYELQMAYANNDLNHRIETLFLLPSLKYSFVSSSLIRTLLHFQTSVKHLMPKSAYKLMKGYL